jgi:DNA repair ATPase RecN
MNNHLHIPAEVFLAPLYQIKAVCEMHQSTTRQMDPSLQAMCRKVKEDHKALPTHLRMQHLFMWEQKYNVLLEEFIDVDRRMNMVIENLHETAQTVLGIDPIFREQALQLLHHIEQIATGNQTEYRRMSSLLDDTIADLQIAC